MKFNNGDIFPSLGLGTWRARPDETFQAVVHAVKTGYRHIDCAFVYGNEKEIGDALEFCFKNKIVNREDLFITSKLWNHSHFPEDIQPAIEISLKDLKIDYLDLYLIHWPIAQKKDRIFPQEVSDMIDIREIPLEKTWEGMIQLKNKGLTKHIGVSNFSIPKMEQLYEATGIYPEVDQVEIHPFFPQTELIQFCASKHILNTAYCPLGSSKLMNTEDSILDNSVIREIAETQNATPAQVVLAWGIQRGTAVIPKSVKPHRIEENFATLDLNLDDMQMEKINSLDRNLRTSMALYSIYEGGSYSVESIFDL